jgi:hypothetical protein
MPDEVAVQDEKETIEPEKKEPETKPEEKKPEPAPEPEAEVSPRLKEAEKPPEREAIDWQAKHENLKRMYDGIDRKYQALLRAKKAPPPPPVEDEEPSEQPVTDIIEQAREAAREVFREEQTRAAETAAKMREQEDYRQVSQDPFFKENKDTIIAFAKENPSVSWGSILRIAKSGAGGGGRSAKGYRPPPAKSEESIDISQASDTEREQAISTARILGISVEEGFKKMRARKAQKVK